MALLLKQLQAHARASGVCIGGRKEAIIDRLKQQWLVMGREPLERVVSVDLGFQNLAYAVVNREGVIEDWQRVTIDLPKEMNPASYAEVLYEFVQAKWAAYLRPSSLFLLERQRFRPFAGSMTPEHILKINAIELQLHCYLRTHSLPILPQSVAKHHGLPHGPEKKKAACHLVADLPCAQPWLEQFNSERKRDDLADSLLQALAFWSWRKHLSQIRDLLDMTSTN